MAQDNEGRKDNDKSVGTMPPEDDTAESKSGAGQSSAGKVSQAMSMPPKRKKSKLLTWLMIIIILLALVLAGLFGWLWWRDRNQGSGEDTSTEPTMTDGTTTDGEPIDEAVCSDGFTIYTNTDLGVQFCYPTAWGEPAVTDAKFEPADTGSRWLVSFDGNDAVHAGLSTSDWATNVPRDGTCVDPATTVLPEFTPFSTAWDFTPEADGSVTFATRGIQMEEDEFLIRETASNLLINGICIEGYKVIANPDYPFVSASYFADYNAEVTNPQQHMDSPNTLVTTDQRNDFAAFVESIVAFEE